MHAPFLPVEVSSSQNQMQDPSAHLRARLVDRLTEASQSYQTALNDTQRPLLSLRERLLQTPPAPRSQTPVTTTLPPKRRYAKRRPRQEEEKPKSNKRCKLQQEAKNEKDETTELLLQELLDTGVLDTSWEEEEPAAEEELGDCDEGGLAFLDSFDWGLEAQMEELGLMLMDT